MNGGPTEIDSETVTELWRAARKMYAKRIGMENAESIVNTLCYAVQRNLLTFESVVNIFLRYAQLEELKEQDKAPPSE